MSKQYPGGIISKTAPVPSGAYENSSAPGIWTLEQQAAYAKLGQWPTAGNTANFIEDVFSTYLYTGNQSTQTITNGIDLAGKGGLVWNKSRNQTYSHNLYDTTRGVNNRLFSDSTSAAGTTSGTLTSFNSDGFSIGSSDTGNFAPSGNIGVSWTFRKQPKFFDVVTYTGNGSSKTINHNLGSVPGVMIVKSTTYVDNWAVYHRSLGATKYIELNNTDAASTSVGSRWDAEPTSTSFSVGYNGSVNASGQTYVAYLFAHDAGGFGLTGTDNVISCGSYTGTGAAGNAITLGYEPQYLLLKRTDSVGSWNVLDNMRGFPVGSEDVLLRPNTTDAETNQILFAPTATGFVSESSAFNVSSASYIYIAIRRGPMKVPTSGTSVFSPQIATSSGSASNTVTTNFPVDLAITQVRNGYFAELLDRLRGDSQSTYVRLRSASTAAEATGAFGLGFDNNTGYVDNYNWQNFGGGPFVYWNFRRAPSFFDEVCYTGNGGYVSRNHNLAAVPEMMIVKARSAAGYNWAVYHSALGFENYVRLNTTAASAGTGDFWYLTPTATQFSTGGYGDIDDTGVTYVNYLFATCAGVSKVGSYTGNGTTQTINCGFTSGARFVLIKRTDATGGWYVYDTARGMTTLTDPYLLLNSTAAESATLGSVTTVSTGFALNSTILADINISGGTYIFLAIA